MKLTRLRRRALSAAAALPLAGIGLLSAAPAQGYAGLSVPSAVVDTDNCKRLSGSLSVQARSGSCYLPDSWDNTSFIKDAGGEAIKIELRDSRGMVGKVEFHPYGEYLWIYDTRDDGDTLYYDLYSSDGDVVAQRAPVNGYRVFNLDIAEGESVTVAVFDDAAREHLITWDWGRA